MSDDRERCPWWTKVLACAALLGAGTGCLVPCGNYEISNTLATTYEGDAYNGAWKEDCGVHYGTSGSWNLFENGAATLDFRPDAPGDRSWMSIDIEISVAFPNARLVPGERIEFADGDLFGGAALNPCIDCRQDQAALTEGYVEVLGGFDGDDVCAEDEGPVYRLEWDLVFGDGTGPTYVVDGTDKVRFSTFLAPECPPSF